MRPWEANIRKVVPYVPGEQPKTEKVIKLNTNENPYPPAPGVAKLLAGMDVDAFRRYPDPGAGELREALADCYGLKQEQIFVGVGSDDVIGMAFLTFFNSEKSILFPDISYSFYKVWAELFRIPYRTPALDDDFKIVTEDYDCENGGVIFPNPNAPTGLLMPLDGVEQIISHNQDVVVIVDEAYIDFGGQTALALLEKYENLLIVQTFSKSRSMAGLRVGYAMGHESLIKALNDVKYSYNSYTMNLPSIQLGAEAVRDDAYFKETLNKIIATREQTKERLSGMGFHFPDSMSNFIFAAHETCPAKELFAVLRRDNIFVRHFDQPRLSNYLRISVGTDGEMSQLCDCLEKYLKGR